MRPNRAAIVVILSGLAALPSPSARADEVSLRATARIAPGAPATLADIAELTGPDAEALGGTIVLPASEVGAGWVRVSIERVTSALRESEGIAWGTLQVRGAACSVSTAAAAQTADDTRDQTPVGQTADTIAPGTIRGVVAARIAARLSIAHSDLRLTFDPGDAELLDMPIAGLAVEVRITGDSDTLPVRIAVFDGERLTAGRAIGVGVALHRTVAIAQRTVSRGQPVREEDLLVEERWVGPSLDPIEPGAAPGAGARTPIRAGQVLKRADLQPPQVIRRGDLVTVSSLSGGVLVRMTARARATVCDGEMVELESLDPDRKQRRTFTARACGRGQAVIAPGTSRADDPFTESLP